MRLGSLAALPALLLVATVIPSLVHAADHSNLEESLPVTVEDAYPIAYGGREVQTLTRYERTPEGDDSVVLEPRVEWGGVRNGQFKLSAPFEVGSADETNSGDVRLEAFYNFNQENGIPAGFRAERSSRRADR